MVVNIYSLGNTISNFIFKGLSIETTDKNQVSKSCSPSAIESNYPKLFYPSLLADPLEQHLSSSQAGRKVNCTWREVYRIGC